MKRLLVLLVAFLALGSSQPIGADRLYDALVDYHAKRVVPLYRHESEEARQERIHWVADGIVHACEKFPLDPKLGWKQPQCVGLAATMAKWESGLLKEVQDGTKKGSAGELCLFQLHHGAANVPSPLYRVTEEERLATVGTSAEAAENCALAGVKTIAWHIHRCKLLATDTLSPARMFELYHWPTIGCEWHLDQMSIDRAASYRRLMNQLQRKEPKRT